MEEINAEDRESEEEELTVMNRQRVLQRQRWSRRKEDKRVQQSRKQNRV